MSEPAAPPAAGGFGGRYGAHPAHLLGHLALFAVVIYAALQVADRPDASRMLLWLAGAVLLHDAVLWPLYALTDAAGRRALGRWVNHVRIPAGLSLLLALVFVGTVTGKGEGAYRNTSGLEWDGYGTRWLLATAALFAASGAVWLWRRRQGSGVKR